MGVWQMRSFEGRCYLRLIISVKDIHWYCNLYKDSAIYSVSLMKLPNPTPVQNLQGQIPMEQPQK